MTSDWNQLMVLGLFMLGASLIALLWVQSIAGLIDDWRRRAARNAEHFPAPLPVASREPEPDDDNDDDTDVFEVGDRVLVRTGHGEEDVWVRGKLVGLTQRSAGYRLLVRLPGASDPAPIEVPPDLVVHDDGVEVVIGYRESAKDVN